MLQCFGSRVGAEKKTTELCELKPAKPDAMRSIEVAPSRPGINARSTNSSAAGVCSRSATT